MSPHPRSILLRPRALLACLASASLAACSEPPAEPVAVGIDFLGRAPDAAVEQPGVLVPDRDEGWGRLGPLGWERRARRLRVDGEEIPFVWSREVDASLQLPTAEPRDREIRFQAWCPKWKREASRRATVRLNDVVLGRVDLVDQPREFALEAPEPAWRRGRNLLQIGVDELRKVEVVERGRVGIALARVEYDVPREIECRPRERSLVLEPSTSVVYHAEELAPLTLSFAARARGEGSLEVRVGRFDPATGAVEPEAHSAQTLALADRRVERGMSIPSSREGVVRIELAWTSPRGDAELSFERLELLEARQVDRPPIVFVSIDTLSAERMSVHGHFRPTTPMLERFAEEAVVFEHCVANAPWTLPSYMSVMTGLYPLAHSIPKRDDWKMLPMEKWYVAENRWTLAEMLRACGYRTGGFVDNQWLTNKFGFAAGFDAYDFSSGEISPVEPDGGIRRTTAMAADWVEERLHDGEPPFVFVHGFDVHGPYFPPEPFRDRFSDDEEAQGGHLALAGGMPNCYEIVPEYITHGYGSEEDPPVRMRTGPIEARYDEGVLMVDEALGRFFERLRELGLYERSLIVVSADHGETMDDGAYLFGHGVLDEEVTHVPLLVRFPGGEHAGRRVAQTVQLVDLYPTIGDFVGLDEDRGDLHGRSLLPLVEARGEEASVEPAPALVESGVMKQMALVHDGWKLVVERPGKDSALGLLLTHPSLDREWRREHFPRVAERGMTEEIFEEIRGREDFGAVLRDLRGRLGIRHALYDLRADPDETRDLSAEEPERLTAMRDRLLAEMARREEARRRAQLPNVPAKLSEQELRDLEALGYVDTGDG